MKYLRYSMIFLLGFFLVSSSVSATEVSEPEEVLEEVQEEVQEDVEPILEDNTPTIVQTYDFSEVNSNLIQMQSVISSSSEYNIALDYVKGLLLNRSNMTDYLFFTSVHDGITHYYLFYDLDFHDGQVLFGNYPCIDIYSIDGVLYQDASYQMLNELPNFAFGSFGNYAALIDKQFHFNQFYVVIAGVLVMFLLFRKRVFS